MASFDSLPESEFRRVYLKKIMAHFRARQGMSAGEARRAAEAMILFLQEQIYHGFPIDLGFLAVRPRRKGPAMIKFNLSKAEKKPVHMVGEHLVFGVKVSELWLRRNQPRWSPR